MLNFDSYMKTISLLAQEAKSPDAPYTEEDLALHLYNQAALLFQEARSLRARAETVCGLGRIVLENNAHTLESYSRHCVAEATRLVDGMDAGKRRAVRAPALPYVTPSEESLPPMCRCGHNYAAHHVEERGHQFCSAPGCNCPAFKREVRRGY